MGATSIVPLRFGLVGACTTLIRSRVSTGVSFAHFWGSTITPRKWAFGTSMSRPAVETKVGTSMSLMNLRFFATTGSRRAAGTHTSLWKYDHGSASMCVEGSLTSVPWPTMPTLTPASCMRATCRRMSPLYMPPSTG